jgi:hypothetical protein
MMTTIAIAIAITIAITITIEMIIINLRIIITYLMDYLSLTNYYSVYVCSFISNSILQCVCLFIDDHQMILRFFFPDHDMVTNHYTAHNWKKPNV